MEKKNTLKRLDQLQPELGNLALFGLERPDSDLSWRWQSVGQIISGISNIFVAIFQIFSLFRK